MRPVEIAAMFSSVVAERAMSVKFGPDITARCPSVVWYTPTSRSDSGYGSGFSSTPLTTLKIALFAPMPSARVTTAMRVNPGALNKRLAA
ncbi:MAG TPA: hypothetical protein VEL51_20345 [Vicinamibacterales bacterium]|nr:hypothetical protein [Vicinamibacterales bacterium]